jgi:hypothetical protein
LDKGLTLGTQSRRGMRIESAKAQAADENTLVEAYMPCGSFWRTPGGVMNGPMVDVVLGGLYWKNGVPVGPSEG